MIVIITGAGISAESGLKTFRDSGGLWEGYEISEVATPEAWNRNPSIVLEFYNQRRRDLLSCQPNSAHKFLAELEAFYSLPIHIITQNVDDLHERAGSKHVLHLHGELLKARSVANRERIVGWKNDMQIGDVDSDGNQFRPHIVWFGEDVPKIVDAAKIVNQASIVIVIGTSLQVYPAAGLLFEATNAKQIIYVDPKPAIANLGHFASKVLCIEKTAVQAVPDLRRILGMD